MIKNYNIDYASHPQEELQLVRTYGQYNTWRVYFDVTEHEDERRTETITVIEYEEKTIIVTDPETGEEREEIITTPVEKEVEVEYRTYESKYIEAKRLKTAVITAIDLMKDQVLKEITEYDISDSVNSFYLNGEEVWLDKDTRVGLMNSTNIQKAAGVEETTLWLGTTPITINCDLAIQMLGALEIYALACFNKTAEHKKNILALETIDELWQYDYTTGYPEKLNFEI